MDRNVPWQESRVQWPEHWTNGGTGITKFAAEDRPLYEAAIKESGRSDLWLKGDELHSDNRSDKGDFWRIFRQLKYGEAASL